MESSTKRKNYISILNSSRELVVYAFCSVTDGQNINRMDVHLYKKCEQKKSELYLIQWPRKLRYPLNVSKKRTDMCNYGVALLLKMIHSKKIAHPLP